MGDVVKNNRYIDGDYVKLKVDKWSLLYCFPKDIYEHEDFQRYTDDYFMLKCKEYDTAYIVDELENKVYWLGKRDEQGKFPHPIAYNERMRRSRKYSGYYKQDYLKVKSKRTVDPEKQKQLMDARKRYQAKINATEEGKAKMAATFAYLNEESKKGGKYYEAKKAYANKRNRAIAVRKRYGRRKWKLTRFLQMQARNEAYEAFKEAGLSWEEAGRRAAQIKKLVSDCGFARLKNYPEECKALGIDVNFTKGFEPADTEQKHYNYRAVLAQEVAEIKAAQKDI